ncbi:hypothetical protein EV192_1027 [Actinocrispum wychmicini]|uniref:Uncharacterized protein n=1 Tax=Actinocrispum wychmicini TaxID=1213861 RepID=A0A4V2S7Z3_9PSEU|nr:hypothetical protein EV192_1027 [Actinocrispum wychmicini]
MVGTIAAPNFTQAIIYCRRPPVWRGCHVCPPKGVTKSCALIRITLKRRLQTAQLCLLDRVGVTGYQGAKPAICIQAFEVLRTVKRVKSGLYDVGSITDIVQQGCGDKQVSVMPEQCSNFGRSNCYTLHMRPPTRQCYFKSRPRYLTCPRLDTHNAIVGAHNRSRSTPEDYPSTRAWGALSCLSIVSVRLRPSCVAEFGSMGSRRAAAAGAHHARSSGQRHRDTTGLPLRSARSAARRAPSCTRESQQPTTAHRPHTPAPQHTPNTRQPASSNHAEPTGRQPTNTVTHTGQHQPRNPPGQHHNYPNDFYGRTSSMVTLRRSRRLTFQPPTDTGTATTTATRGHQRSLSFDHLTPARRHQERLTASLRKLRDGRKRPLLTTTTRC